MTFNGDFVAFIGAGMMGEAMIKGLLHQQVLAPDKITASDPRAEHLDALRQRYGIHSTTDNVAAAAAGDALVLSVKPQVMGKVLSELSGHVDSISLILSIVAGVESKTISESLRNGRVVRAMPNTPGQIGRGITVWTAAPQVADIQRQQAEMLLGALGDQIYVNDESFLDMATALSGSGPAYVFMFMEALIDAGVHMGFARSDAEQLVTQTLLGSILYAQQSGLHPAQLRNQVTSPGGTTAAALHEMEKGGLRTVLSEGVWAAYRRSQALGAKSD